MGQENKKGIGFSGLVDIEPSPPTPKSSAASTPPKTKAPLPPPVTEVKVKGSGFLGTWTIGAKLGVAVLIFIIGAAIWSSFQPPPPPPPPRAIIFDEPSTEASSGMALDFYGLCWCRRESMVIDQAKTRIDRINEKGEYDNLVHGFNHRVKVFNTKCSNRDYLATDGQELDSRSDEISEAAKAELDRFLSTGE